MINECVALTEAALTKATKLVNAVPHDHSAIFTDRRHAGATVDECDGLWLMKMRMCCGFIEFDDAYEVWIDGTLRVLSVIKVPTDHYEYLILRRCHGIGHKYVDGPLRLLGLIKGKMIFDGAIPPPTPWMHALTDDNVEDGELTGTPCLPCVFFCFVSDRSKASVLFEVARLISSVCRPLQETSASKNAIWRIGVMELRDEDILPYSWG